MIFSSVENLYSDTIRRFYNIYLCEILVHLAFIYNLVFHKCNTKNELF